MRILKANITPDPNRSPVTQRRTLDIHKTRGSQPLSMLTVRVRLAGIEKVYKR